MARSFYKPYAEVLANLSSTRTYRYESTKRSELHFRALLNDEVSEIEVALVYSALQ